MLRTTRLLPATIIVFGFLLAVSCRSGYLSVPEKTETGVIRLDSAGVPEDDVASAQIISPYKQRVDAEMNEILGYSEIDLVKSQPEGLLNNFITDLVLKKTNEIYSRQYNRNVDICLMNNGGLRGSIPKGAVTRMTIFQLMPFENKTVVLTLSGKDTRYMMNFIARSGGMPLAGATMGISGDTATNIKIGGEPLNLEKNYTIVTSDYLADGGDEMFFFSRPVEFVNLQVLIRDLIIEYLKEETALGNTVTAKLDKRIYYEK